LGGCCRRKQNQELGFASKHHDSVQGVLRALGALSHEHIAPVLALNMVMERNACWKVHIVVPRMPALDSGQRPVPPAAVLEIALGMQYLHGQGMAHKSLKPSNILLNDHGSVCIAGCSFAALEPFVLREYKNYEELVANGIAYKAPEQFVKSLWLRKDERGNDNDDNDDEEEKLDWTRADVYAFGVIVAEMVNRRPPNITTKNLASAMKKVTDRQAC
jgi:hypothetical protein